MISPLRILALAVPTISACGVAASAVASVAQAQASSPAAPGTGPGTADTAAAMRPDRDIVTNLAQSTDHAQLNRALVASGLSAVLAAPGPFTLFAPTDAAFSRLAPGALDTLLQPANRDTLVRVLTYHALPGNVTLADLRAQIAAGGGRATLRTIANQPLIASAHNGAVMLTDANGNSSFVTVADLPQSNGLVHVVNGMVLPTLG